MKRLLVIANLEHASPRIPALLVPMVRLGWRATVVTPPLAADAHAALGLPEGFETEVEIEPAPWRGDIFRLWRGLLRRAGFARGGSLTEQIKDRVGGGGGRRRLVDGVMYGYQTLFGIPDTEWPWHRPALAAAERALARGRVDALLSSSPHPTVHRVAAVLARRHGLPWVADFRDPWSQNHAYALPAPRRRLDQWLEVRTLRGASRITTVSAGFAAKLERLHGPRVSIVRNGYQPAPGQGEPFPERFTLRYTGSIYAGKQDPSQALAALGRLIRAGALERERVRLEFYGRHDSALAAAIQAEGLEDVALQMGALPRERIRALQRGAHLLLLLQWEVREEQGIFPLKFYEYLDAGRPILATGGFPGGEIEAILAETGTGHAAIGPQAIETALLAAYREWRETGAVAWHGRAEAVSGYSYAGSARDLAACLDQVSTAAPPP